MNKNQIKAIWEETLSLVEKELSKPSFETWIIPAYPLEYKNSTLYIAVPNEFAKDWLESRYYKLIEKSLETVFNKPIPIKFVIPNDEINDTNTSSQEKDFNKERYVEQRITTPPALLNPKYTFESFVVGNSNRFAHAASLAVAESPAKAYNPLFIYGGVGLGKTHLMHAIGHFVLNTDNNLNVLYVSSEKFTNELIIAIRDDKTVAFRNKYRNIDILLIDDIQFLAGKERTQEEFFHTFNALHEANKQLIISSDRPPKDIPTLEDRLRSRFEWGLITDMQRPDLETRIAILQKKARLETIDIPDDVMLYIATQIQSNIRELEGSLIRVMAYASLTKRAITSELASEALKDILPNKVAKPITISLIQEVVSEHYGLRVEDLKARKRTRAVAFPRQIAMFLSRELTDNSLPKIGEVFGGRDHTTVIHAQEKISQDLAKDPSLKIAMDKIREKLNDS